LQKSSIQERFRGEGKLKKRKYHSILEKNDEILWLVFVM